MFFCDLDRRTNPLSLIPGGFVVAVRGKNNRVVNYPNVKNTKMYIDKALEEGALEAWVVGKNEDFDFNRFEAED